MSIATITTGDGCDIAFRIDGPSAAPVLLLSNSLGTDMSLWDDQIPLFSQFLRVLRYDTRGHGRSGTPQGAYGIDRLGRDALELLDALQVDRAHVCGVSLGGMIAQWLGARTPERVLSLAICNSSALMAPPSAWDERIRVVLAQGMVAIVDGTIERWFTPAYRESLSIKLEQISASLLNTSPVGYAGCCAAIRDMDLRAVLDKIAAPTLVIAGTADPATPLWHSELLARSIANARLVMLPAAHLSNLECAAEFGKHVLASVLDRPVYKL